MRVWRPISACPLLADIVVIGNLLAWKLAGLLSRRWRYVRTAGPTGNGPYIHPSQAPAAQNAVCDPVTGNRAAAREDKRADVRTNRRRLCARRRLP
jgi:hypothetical protein